MSETPEIDWEKWAQAMQHLSDAFVPVAEKMADLAQVFRQATQR